MKLATAPVNWNSPDVPEYRAYTPYPQLLEEMVAAGYPATEWSSIMPKEPAVLAEDLRARGLRMLGGFVGLELRDPAKREQEVVVEQDTTPLNPTTIARENRLYLEALLKPND
jgi:hypothetical protein